MDVFTHGLEVRPFSTALRASSAAPSITEGFEVLVHDVIAATTTAPWSSTNSPCSSDFTVTGLDGLPSEPLAAEGRTSDSPSSANDSDTESLAGKDSSTASSSLVSGAGLFSST